MNARRKLARESGSGVPPLSPEVGRVAPNALWPVVPLGDIAEFIMGQAPPGEASNFDGVGTVFVKAGEFGPLFPEVREWTTRPLRFARKGDVLICVVGATAGKLNLGIDCAIGRSVAAIRPNESILDRFLYLQLLPQVLTLRAASTGSAQGVINKQMLADIGIVLPPLPEQRLIVAAIEAQFTKLDAGLAALKRVQANLKRYRAAVLKAACEGAWARVPISRLVRTMDQGWSPKCETAPATDDSTWAVIKTTAIQGLRFLENENKALPSILAPRKHLELQSGDLLVTRAGPRSRVGIACLVKTTRPRLMLCDKAYRIRVIPSVAHAAYVELVLNAPHVLDEVDKLKSGISDSGLNLTQKRFADLQIPLPPLAEQTRIVAEVERRLSVIDELESLVATNLARATRLRQAVLQQAFTGGVGR